MPIVELPLELNELSPNVELKNSTANVESEIIKIVVPRKASYGFLAGISQLFLAVFKADGTQITNGVVRAYKKDPNLVQALKVVDVPVVKLGEMMDKNKAYFLNTSFTLGEDQILSITFTGADVVDKAKTKFVLTGKQALEVIGL
jgi:hypothetical protein